MFIKHLKYLFIGIVVLSALFVWAEQSDFEVAEEAYKQKKYKIAQVYLEHLLQEDPFNTYVPDATYYLIQIYDKHGDFINLATFANRFITHHIHDPRCKEIFNVLLARLIEKKAYSIAFDYIQEYDYLTPDIPILENVGYGLLQQNQVEAADYVFSLCPQIDTIRIVRANLESDSEQKEHIFKTIEGVRGKIYLIEHYLALGDTVFAYNVYETIRQQEISADILYRFTKIALLFENTATTGKYIEQLSSIDGFSNKAVLLQALVTGHLNQEIAPMDAEEMRFLIEIYGYNSISTAPPEQPSLDSLLSAETLDTLAAIGEMRIAQPNNHHLDSLYAEILINKGRVREAYNMMLPYLRYENVRNNVRRIRGLHYFEEKAYEAAMKEIILSKDKSPEAVFLLAECSRKTGHDPSALYAEVLRSAQDSTLFFRALKGFVEVEFANANYHHICEYEPGVFENDTILMTMYIKSLARIGKKKMVDSLVQHFITGVDYEIEDHYGQFLIDNKSYAAARSHYDSVVQTAEGKIPEDIFYNWALVPFLQGKVDTSLARFTYYTNNIKGAKDYSRAYFKIATINYVQGGYDTAGYYYGKAS